MDVILGAEIELLEELKGDFERFHGFEMCSVGAAAGVLAVHCGYV